jgi:hypothetical protein
MSFERVLQKKERTAGLGNGSLGHRALLSVRGRLDRTGRSMRLPTRRGKRGFPYSFAPLVSAAPTPSVM